MPGLTEPYDPGDLSSLKREALEDWLGVGVGGVDGLDLARRLDSFFDSL